MVMKPENGRLLSSTFNRTDIIINPNRSTQNHRDAIICLYSSLLNFYVVQIKLTTL